MVPLVVIIYFFYRDRWQLEFGIHSDRFTSINMNLGRRTTAFWHTNAAAFNFICHLVPFLPFVLELARGIEPPTT